MNCVLTLLLGFLLVAASAAAEEPRAIRAAFASGALPVHPDDPTWDEAPESTVTLMPQLMLLPQGGGSVTRIGVRALHDGRRLVFRFEWSDETENREVGVDRFRDAVAIGFPTRESERVPAPFMGDAENPVNIWQWTADFDANARGQGAFAKRYPHTEGVWYFPQDDSVTRDVRSWRGFEPVIELTARGWGTLERKVSQNVFGIGEHEGGRWRVVLQRDLATGNPTDTLFRPGSTTPVILAVWDGEKREVNQKKSVTMQWTPLELDPTPGAELARE